MFAYSLNNQDLFFGSRGVHTYAAGGVEDEDREVGCNIEMGFPDGSGEEFSQTAGIRIQGVCSCDCMDHTLL